ncbi:MAG: HAMP domain-containing histidine kinase [Oscillospiraceae bacterium]|nr:HAMP domain-containing histidine kinase [Oscillospiraceae bacterium]
MKDYKGIETALYLVLLAITAAICWLLHPVASVIVLCTGLTAVFLRKYFDALRRRQISKLCDEISSILHGAEQVTFDSYSEGELSILASEIGKMTARLREQNAALRQERSFMQESLEDISHQLRTPLTSVILLVDLMRKPNLTKAQQYENLQELQSMLSRMQWMIETLLGLSRLDAGSVTFQKTEFSCRTLIADALEPISIALELKDIAVNLDIGDEDKITGDLPYCTEAFCNLLKNCMEHTPEGGTITISSETNAIYTGILITDSGSGISETDLPHVFERFYRGTPFSKTGYGIGLSFARRIITSQGGSIQVRNIEPHGAQFDIRFYHSVV